jgi:hypothetical protein
MKDAAVSLRAFQEDMSLCQDGLVSRLTHCYWYGNILRTRKLHGTAPRSPSPPGSQCTCIFRYGSGILPVESLKWIAQVNGSCKLNA